MVRVIVALMWACAIVLLGGVLAAPAAAAKVARPAVEARLRAHHLGPSEQDIRALGPGTDEALVAIAGDDKTDVLLRARAVSALAYCPTPVSRKFLERLLGEKVNATATGERLLARKAAMALGWLGGPGVPAQLAPLLAHADPEVRLDAALGLGLTRLGSAAAILRERLPVERDGRVRAQIGRQLRVIEAALVPPPGAGKEDAKPDTNR
jgi:hypothetical protein